MNNEPSTIRRNDLLEDEFGDIIKKARRGLGISAEDIHGATGIDAAGAC